MVRTRRRCSFVACVLLSLTLVGCGDSDSANPTAPSPSPTPAAQTFTVSGTVSETAPTSSTRVEGVQVSIQGATSATTDAAGNFTIAGVPSGTHTLTASKADFQTRTVTVAVSGANVTGVQVSLAPTARIVREEHNGSIRGDGAPCFGTSKACHVYRTGAHSDGEVSVFLVWNVPDVNFELEMRCDGEVVGEEQAPEARVRELRVQVRGGQQCELHVLFTGEMAEYGVFLSYPY